MALWFETSVSYDKTQENGTIKKVIEKNLFDALSFTEAEARTIDELTPYISGEFTVKAAKKTKISEIFFNESGDRFYLVKTAFVSIDERTGMDKESISLFIVQANDFDSAVISFKESMKGVLADWVIKSVSETSYLGVYPAKD